MQTIEPKRLNIPEHNRYVLETITQHVETVNQDILQFHDNEPIPTPPETMRNHFSPLPYKPKSLLCSIQRRKVVPKLTEREQDPHQRFMSCKPSYVHTEPRKISNRRQIPPLISNSDGEKECPILKPIPKQYIKELNKIDSATLNSLRNFLMRNEAINVEYAKMRKDLIRVIQRENKLFMIASDEFLQLQKEDFITKRSTTSENLDYILSKLTHADYHNIHQKFKNQNENCEKMKRKQMNMIENQRHEKVQRLFNRMDKKLSFNNLTANQGN